MQSIGKNAGELESTVCLAIFKKFRLY